MSDRIFLHLGDDWALGYDKHQWMLLRGRKWRSQRKWQPVAFVASTKRILRRELRRNDVNLTSEASEYLDAMPDSFREWLHWYEVAAPDWRAA